MKKFLGISALVLASAFSMAACDDDTDGGPVCGNGIIEVGEACDSTELGGRSCVNEGYVGGTLRCAGDCQTYLKSQCHKCGNNHIDDDEACDGDDFGSASCEASGFGSGELSCSDDCMAIDESACSTCGDNYIDDGETCDGTALGGKNCQAFGYEGGTLVCESTCEGYVATYCHLCGNGDLDDGEVCDGEAFGELSCADEGFAGGSLNCNAECSGFTTETCSVSTDELCGIYYGTQDMRRVLDVPSSCLVAPATTRWDDYDETEKELACRPGQAGRVWAENMMASEAAGRLDINWVKAKSCLEAAQDFRATHAGYLIQINDPDWVAIVEGVCADFSTGLVVENENCIYDWDCEAGLLCQTSTPDVADSLKCKPPLEDGDSYVLGYTQCNSETTWEDGNTSTCVAYLGESDVDCDTGRCGTGLSCEFVTGNNICVAVAALLADGEACTESSTCETFGDQCGTCRSISDGAAKVCALKALEDEYCEFDYDCMSGLGCLDNLCQLARLGESCAVLDCDHESLCANHCEDLLSTEDCGADSRCTWDGTDSKCTNIDGPYCRTYPVVGERCLQGMSCDEGYCDATTAMCVPTVAEGEACSWDGVTAPECHYRLFCDDVCLLGCENDAECDEGEYCPVYINKVGPPPVCQPIVAAECIHINACGPDKYCSFDTDPTSCVDKLALGAVCDPADSDSYGSYTCVSGWCAEDVDSADYVCSVNGSWMTHITNNLEFFYSAFLMGLVVAIRRRRK